MGITIETVKKIAHLANLEFSSQELEKYTHQLDDIIKYVEKLDELDTDDVPPTAHVLSLVNVMREDEVVPWADAELALINAPVSKQGFFSVPKVIG